MNVKNDFSSCQNFSPAAAKYVSGKRALLDLQGEQFRTDTTQYKYSRTDTTQYKYSRTDTTQYKYSRTDRPIR